MSSPEDDESAKHPIPVDICLDCFQRLIRTQTIIRNREIRRKDLPVKVKFLREGGMSFVEIAAQLGRTENTIKAAFHCTGAYSNYRPKEESSDAPIVAEDA